MKSCLPKTQIWSWNPCLRTTAFRRPSLTKHPSQSATLTRDSRTILIPYVQPQHNHHHGRTQSTATLPQLPTTFRNEDPFILEVELSPSHVVWSRWAEREVVRPNSGQLEVTAKTSSSYDRPRNRQLQEPRCLSSRILRRLFTLHRHGLQRSRSR